MIFRIMVLKKNMKLNHNQNIAMVTTEILEIFSTNIVSFIHLTMKLYSPNNEFLVYSFTQVFMKNLCVSGTF